MTREKLIEYSRKCAESNINGCEQCPFLGDESCIEDLLREMADMLEKDKEVSE